MLDITDEGYQDFREDAECLVRPQSLIGERFVECELTQARAAGTDPPPALERIEDGPGEGQYLLPVERNGKAVDLDLVNNIMRQPVRERLVDHPLRPRHRRRRARQGPGRGHPPRRPGAARGRRGAEDPRRSRTTGSPTWRSTRTRSCSRSPASGGASAGRSTNMSEVAEATAERRADLEADIERLPTFLRELRPTMVRLGALSDEMTPVLTDLGDVAPDINRLVLQLGPFAQAARPALDSLGEAAEAGHPGGARGAAGDPRPAAAWPAPCGRWARTPAACSSPSSAPAASTARWTTSSTRWPPSTGSTRSATTCGPALLVNQCSNYAITAAFGCSSNFASASASAAARAAVRRGKPRDPVLRRTAAALARALGLPGGEDAPAPARKRRAQPAGARAAAGAGRAGAGAAPQPPRRPPPRRARRRRRPTRCSTTCSGARDERPRAASPATPS